MKVINLERFKEECAKFEKPALKALLWDFALERVLHELVFVNAINNCRKNGEAIPKTETLANYAANLEGERVLINLLGRREAAKVYGVLEGITSDVKTVDYILTNDSVKYYSDFILSEKYSKES
jgi:hypothetical protein